MNAEQVTSYIMRLPAVVGCFIVDEEGLTLSSQVPEDFSREIIFGMATDAIDAMETFRAGLPGCSELRLDLEGITLLIRSLQDHLLFVFVDEPAEVAAVRTGAIVCSKRYNMSGQPGEGIPQSMSEIMAKAKFQTTVPPPQSTVPLEPAVRPAARQVYYPETEGRYPTPTGQ